MAWKIFTEEQDGVEVSSSAATLSDAVALASAHADIGYKVLRLVSSDGHVIEDDELDELHGGTY